MDWSEIMQGVEFMAAQFGAALLFWLQAGIDWLEGRL